MSATTVPHRVLVGTASTSTDALPHPSRDFSPWDCPPKWVRAAQMGTRKHAHQQLLVTWKPICGCRKGLFSPHTAPVTTARVLYPALLPLIAQGC